jgi:hypothetical protein
MRGPYSEAEREKAKCRAPYAPAMDHMLEHRGRKKSIKNYLFD